MTQYTLAGNIAAETVAEFLRGPEEAVLPHGELAVGFFGCAQSHFLSFDS